MWVKSIWFALSISSKPKRTRLGNMGQIEGAADWGHSFFDPKGPRKQNVSIPFQPKDRVPFLRFSPGKAVELASESIESDSTCQLHCPEAHSRHMGRIWCTFDDS